MNIYTVIIRHSTVTFALIIVANSKKAARRLAGKRIRKNYPNFKVYRIQ